MIELRGVGTANKGAHLMLLSIISEFNNRQISEEFCIEPGFGMDFFEAGKNGLFLKEKFRGKKIPWAKLLMLLSKKIRREHGLILPNEVDVILDGSGFSYGDFWGADKINSRYRDYSRLKKDNPNSRIILMPQALGSFNDPLVKKAFENMLDLVDLVFARDSVSYKHITDNFGTRNNVMEAPDFTNLLFSGEEKLYHEGNVCIIPNYRMIPNEVDQKKYYSFMIDCINEINNNQAKPYFLIHEGMKDKKIAEDINKLLESPLEIIEPNDPLEIKNRIKSAQLVVVSRFHGLVSALSQGVPAIATSWSHKYIELAKSYSAEDSVFDIKAYESDNLRSLIKTFLKRTKNDHYDLQKSFIEIQKEKSNKMWNEVFKIIN